MDYGHEQTDRELKKLERKLAREYKAAKESVERKIKKHLEQFSDLDAKYAKMVEEDKMSEKDYKRWRQSAMVRTDAWKDLRDTLASDLSHTNEIAIGMINDHAIDCYALNMNYGTYEIENGYHIGTSFSMYDHRTVENLMKEDPQIIPKARVDIPEDKRWNRQKLTSAITQGILTGDSIPDIAKRLGSVADMNAHAAVRNARTYTTAAENKGRTDSYERAQNMGIELEQEWLATLDQRTRSSHVHMDGERVKIGAKFSNGCRYPGDPAGRPEEIYNCFIADTSVATDCNIVRAYKHEYSGILLTIKTSGGINFTCTPNHPILTRRGWVHANMLNKGDDILVTCIRNKGLFGWNPHINHVFTRFDALFKAIDISGCERTRTLSVNFHGDIPASEVEIVTKKRFLRNNGDISGCKFVNKFLLKFSNKTLMCKRALMKHVRRIRLSLFGFMCRICKPFPFLVCGLRHSEIHGLRPVALLNSCGVQSLENNVSGNMELLRQSIDGFSGVIFSDNIVSVDVDSGCTHVYNLQSENGYYFVNSSIAQNKQKDNGIMAITKNCRCTLVAALKGYNYQDDRFSRLPAGMTYEEWKAEAEKRNAPEKSFADRVHEIMDKSLENSGQLSQDDIKAIGKIFAGEVEKEYLGPINKEIEEAQRQLNALGAKEIDDLDRKCFDIRKIRRGLMDPEELGYSSRDEALAEYTKALNRIDEIKNNEAYAKAEGRLAKAEFALTDRPAHRAFMRNKIGEIREVGIGDLDVKGHLMNSRSPVRKSIEEAYDCYPHAWVQRSVNSGFLKPKKVDRGYYDNYNKEIAISGREKESQLETAIHELGHRYERVVPGIREQEKEFYERRTAGEPLQWLGYGYSRNEVSRKDDFLHPYMGKDYGGFAYELVSMGFEYAYTDPARLAKDPDMQEWILGMLLSL